jgi:hypothetical protein
MKKKHVHNVLTTIFLAILIVACSEDDPEPAPTAFQPQHIAVDTIYQSLDDGELLPDQDFRIIEDDATWQQFLTEYNNGRTTPPLGSDRFNTTQIDFTQNLVFVLRDSLRPSHWFAIDVDSVIEYQSDVKVFLNRYEVVRPGPTFFSKPLFIGQMPDVGKPVVFEN